jgi:hypothetical protein
MNSLLNTIRWREWDSARDLSVYDAGVVLGFEAMWFRCSMPTFRRNMPSPFSPQRWNRPTKPHGNKTQDNAIILIAVRI